MPQPCTICTHPNRSEIDRLIVAGEPNRRIATQCGVSEASIRRHRVAHLPQRLVKAQQAKEVAQADTLLGEVRSAKGRSERLYKAAEDILERALQAADLKTALRAIAGAVDVMREARAHLELEGEITGELRQEGSGGSGQVVIILPARVPVGTPAPPNVRDLGVSEEEVERSLRERGGPVIEVPAVEVQRESRRLLAPRRGEQGEAA